VMNLKAVLDEMGGTAVTPDAIAAAIRTGSAVPSFMTDTYTCDGKVPASPSTCVRGRRVLKVTGAKLADLSDRWYDGTSQVSLG
jgi:hypothetical protein